MPLLQVLVVLTVVGVVLWLINRFLPVQGTIKPILNAVVVIAVVLWLLNIFELFNSFAHIRVGSEPHAPHGKGTKPRGSLSGPSTQHPRATARTQTRCLHT